MKFKLQQRIISKSRTLIRLKKTKDLYSTDRNQVKRRVNEELIDK